MRVFDFRHYTPIRIVQFTGRQTEPSARFFVELKKKLSNSVNFQNNDPSSNSNTTQLITSSTHKYNNADVIVISTVEGVGYIIEKFKTSDDSSTHNHRS